MINDFLMDHLVEKSKSMLFGIFDGHNGDIVSKYLKDNISNVFNYNLILDY